jgi:hypothetical protein
MMALAIACAWAIILAAGPAFAAPIKVACVGDNNTHSDLYPVASPMEYPALLQKLMGAGYNVVNFGDCCASVVQGPARGDVHPYVDGSGGRSPAFKESLAFLPDIVVIGAWGRHDWGQQKAPNWSLALFQTDYDDLVTRYMALANHPKIYVSLPIPILFGNGTVPDNGTTTESVLPAIKAVAAKYNLPIIDLYTPFTGRKDLFQTAGIHGEGEHLSDTGGFQFLANTVYAALMGGGDGGAGGSADAAVGTDAAADDAAGPSSPAPADAATTNDAGTPGTGTQAGSDDAGGSAMPMQGGGTGGANEAGAANNASGSTSGSGGGSSSGCSMSSNRGRLPSSIALVACASMWLFVARRRRKPTVQPQQ